MHHMIKKMHVTPHFKHCDQTNAVVTLMIPLTTQDANAGANGITRPKSHIASHFSHPDVTNAIVPLMTLL